MSHLDEPFGRAIWMSYFGCAGVILGGILDVLFWVFSHFGCAGVMSRWNTGCYFR